MSSKSRPAMWFLLVGIGLGFWPVTLSAQESKPTFSGILDEQAAETFARVKVYIEMHPEAPDAESAYRWLFQAARERGWEEQALPLADRYLERNSEKPWKELARGVRTVGYARAGQWEEALLAFEGQLANIRLRMAADTVDLAKTLAVEAQAAGRVDTAREIYHSLSRSLFLNPDVKQLCEMRLAKLELVGKPAPAVTVRNLEGKAVDLGDYKGKWLLLDFWATNCPPCLEEMPRLKRLYETHHARGFEIVGISLDEDPETVAGYQNRQNLPWTLALSKTDEGRTRENYRVSTIPAMYLLNPEGNIELTDPTPRDLERLLPGRLKKRKP